MQCYCNSGKDRNQCCGPLLAGQQEATSPEQLMRSRYSAYVSKNYDYVLKTYTASKRADLTVSALEESASGTTWLHLDVLQTDTNHVEFRAWYAERRKTGVLHETSLFLKENDCWRYDSGKLHDDTGTVKISRNDPCFCQSGKKFKVCCQRKTGS